MSASSGWQPGRPGGGGSKDGAAEGANFKVVIRTRPPLARELHGDRPFTNVVKVRMTTPCSVVSPRAMRSDSSANIYIQTSAFLHHVQLAPPWDRSKRARTNKWSSAKTWPQPLTKTAVSRATRTKTSERTSSLSTTFTTRHAPPHLRPVYSLCVYRRAVRLCLTKYSLGSSAPDGARACASRGARQDASQQEVYDNTARGVVDSSLAGYNATIFAYGQTGTGKTYTMEGYNSREGQVAVEDRGIIPRAIEQIFSHIGDHASPRMRFLVRASYLQARLPMRRVGDRAHCLLAAWVVSGGSLS